LREINKDTGKGKKPPPLANKEKKKGTTSELRQNEPTPGNSPNRKPSLKQGHQERDKDYDLASCAIQVALGALTARKKSRGKKRFKHGHLKEEEDAIQIRDDAEKRRGALFA